MNRKSDPITDRTDWTDAVCKKNSENSKKLNLRYLIWWSIIKVHPCQPFCKESKIVFFEIKEKKFILGQLDKIECELNELAELEKEEQKNDAE